jgi:hypothetical protein
VPIVRVDHRPVRDGVIGILARQLQRLYFDATRGRLGAYRKWLLPVYQARHTPATDPVSVEASLPQPVA